ncbi:MAG: hypothetical protein RIA69_11995, partial [Cyclobacteriaceae bacterium]
PPPIFLAFIASVYISASRTTEIYTHIALNGLSRIQNPLDLDYYKLVISNYKVNGLFVAHLKNISSLKPPCLDL